MRWQSGSGDTAFARTKSFEFSTTIARTVWPVAAKSALHDGQSGTDLVRLAPVRKYRQSHLKKSV
ncbi:MAG: hypothetical protein P4N60_02040 [Verrucomicrobiae bacterium]|nr:hypothetical protein [Verrucomicrobiae bacterium]